ncbi:MAG: Gfo/Idh/MocA family oxidoreductase [Thermoplasmatota archaeon]
MDIGVVGLGSMGWNHARVLSSLGALGAVLDADARRAREAGAAYQVPVADDARSLLDACDAIVVATPTEHHHDVALQAIQAGKHVLVEKPIAATPIQAQALIDAAAAQGVCLAVGHIERHNPVVAYARQAIEGGRLGDLLSLNARRVSSFPGRIRDVGCIMDIGIHEIDIVRYLSGSEVTRVSAVAGCHRANGHEDHATLLLRMANDTRATIETNWLTPMRVRRNTLTLTGAIVEVDYMEQTALVSTAEYGAGFQASKGRQDLDAVPMEYNDQRVVLRRQEPLRNELQDFIQAIQANRAPLVGGEDGLRALLIAEAAVASAKSGRGIDLPAAGEALTLAV